jgi:hypothetical protein
LQPSSPLIPAPHPFTSLLSWPIRETGLSCLPSPCLLTFIKALSLCGNPVPCLTANWHNPHNSPWIS